MLLNLQAPHHSMQVPETGLIVLGKLILPGTGCVPGAKPKLDYLEKTTSAGRTTVSTHS